jgi:hypothetical protein
LALQEQQKRGRRLASENNLRLARREIGLNLKEVIMVTVVAAIRRGLVVPTACFASEFPVVGEKPPVGVLSHWKDCIKPKSVRTKG